MTNDTSAEVLIGEHVERAMSHVAMRRAEAFKSFASVMLRSRHIRAIVESPLEMIFLVWWNAVVDAETRYQDFVIEPQAEVAVAGQRYRVDFVITPPSDERLLLTWKPIAIEVDGHYFHERTKEQVQIRDARDRALLAAGWRVFHFSFAEFTENPAESVKEVMEFAWMQAYR